MKKYKITLTKKFNNTVYLAIPDQTSLYFSEESLHFGIKSRRVEKFPIIGVRAGGVAVEEDPNIEIKLRKS